MEVEVKLQLGGAAAHAALAAALAQPQHQAELLATHEQENFFFDGAGGELAAARAVLRLRLYGGDKKAMLTLKGKMVLQDGIGRTPEQEEQLRDAAAARHYVDDPSALLGLLDSDVVRRLRSEFGVSALVPLGGFRNVRHVYRWRGQYTLELDETRYDFGTAYELEAETDRPEELRPQLEELLTSLGCAYAYSTVSKFGAFRAGALPPQPA